MIELVAIVSSFNRAGLLKEAMASLLAGLSRTTPHSMIYVIDAGSTDGSQELVREIATNAPIPVELIESSGVSFSAGVNLAVKRALHANPTAKHILLFETDNLFTSETPITTAIGLLAAHGKLGAVGFTALKYDGAPAGFGRNHPRWLEFILGPQIAFRLGLDRPGLHWLRDGEIEWARSDVVYTSPVLIRREAWTATAGFDENAFPFSDCDLDWAFRLKESGFDQAVIRTCHVVHDNRTTLSPWSASRALHFHQARLKLLQRQRGSFPLAIPLLALRHLAEMGLAAVRPPKGGNYLLRLAKRARLLKRCFGAYR